MGATKRIYKTEAFQKGKLGRSGKRKIDVDQSSDF